ncbi:MAG: GldG family protein [Deltaproteobacteria bacterium]|nr:GldG family protein [Deltaproteobacteria bacterium]
MNRTLYLGSAAGCLVSLNLLAATVYGRVDLTEDRMYTLTPASRELVSELDDQLIVKAYFSENLPAPFNGHAKFLRDKLDEYRNYAHGRMTVEFIDPEKPGADGKPSDELLAQVRAAQIPKVEVNKFEKDQIQVVNVYMGVALAYGDKIETLPILRDVNDLEYELTSRIAALTRSSRTRVGVLTGHGSCPPPRGCPRWRRSSETNTRLPTSSFPPASRHFRTSIFSWSPAPRNA